MTKHGSVDDAEVTRFLDAWFAVRQLIQAANFNHFHQAGLSATQFMTLNVLPADGDSITIGELAKRMNLKPATVARTVDSLEARQMVTRTKSLIDGRVILVKITGQGKQFQNAAVGHFRNHISKLFGAIPAADRGGLVAGLESLVRAAAEQGPVLTAEDRAVARGARSSRQSPQR